MEQQQQQQTTGGYMYDNEQSLNALSLRLDTNKILDRFELFLRAEKVSEKVEGGHLIFFKDKKQNVEPKLNEEGIDGIMNYLHSNFNTQTVQANLGTNDYKEHIKEVHKRIALLLWVNWYEWEVKEKNYPLIMASLRDMLKLFLTRPINNKERDSYIPFMRNTETIVQQEQSSKGFPFFGNKNN